MLVLGRFYPRDTHVTKYSRLGYRVSAHGEGAYGEYEYYKGAQFSGKELREDVELRTVVREGGEPTE